MNNNKSIEKLVIIGSGPAGLTAATYAARGSLQPLVIAGREAGGQLMLTTDVDDYPGFPDGIQGPELMDRMRRQAERFDTQFIDENVISVNFNLKPFEIQTESKKIQAQSVIVATGASARWLDIPSEQRLRGHGVSACAVCDGLFFKDKSVIVVGGGDTAFREAQHLSKICRKVIIVHRQNRFRAQVALQDLLKSKPNIEFLMNKILDEVLGEEKVTGVRLKDATTGKMIEIAVEGVFIAIGHKPNTDFLKGQLALDTHGYIIATNEVFSSIKGVFVAGDVADFTYRQAATAVGSGTKAALTVESYLEKLGQK